MQTKKLMSGTHHFFKNEMRNIEEVVTVGEPRDAQGYPIDRSVSTAGSGNCVTLGPALSHQPVFRPRATVNQDSLVESCTQPAPPSGPDPSPDVIM